MERLMREVSKRRKTKLFTAASTTLALAGLGSFIFGIQDDFKVVNQMEGNINAAQRILPSPSHAQLQEASLNIESLLDDEGADGTNISRSLEIVGVDSAQGQIAQLLNDEEGLYSRVHRDTYMVVGGVVTFLIGTLGSLSGMVTMKREKYLDDSEV